MKIRTMMAVSSILIGLLLCIAIYQLVLIEAKQEGEIQLSGALCASTGNLVKLLFNNVGANDVEGTLKSSLTESIRQQSMIILGLNLDVSKFDANALEGICEIVARKDILFPISLTSSVTGVRNNLLNSQFSRIRGQILSESLSRSVLFGNASRCALRP